MEAPNIYPAPVLERPEPFDVLCKQKDNEPEWHRLRTTGISASIVPEILELFPKAYYDKGYKRPRAHVLRDLALTDPLVEADVARKDNPALECGIRCEPMVIAWACDLTSRLFLPWGELLRSRAWPWMLATPDGANREGVRDELIEVKCTRYPWKDGLPEYVRAQVMAQLAVTGYPAATVAQWSWGCRPELYPVERNEKLIELIAAKCREAFEEVEAIRAKGDAR